MAIRAALPVSWPIAQSLAAIGCLCFRGNGRYPPASASVDPALAVAKGACEGGGRGGLTAQGGFSAKRINMEDVEWVDGVRNGMEGRVHGGVHG